jgi:predicted O-methyltransferase YrrM
MSTRTVGLSDAVYEYLLRTFREPEVLADLRRETAAMPMSRMQIAPEQGQLMRLIIELLGARRCLEIGVFTGYSALSVALALPEDGRLVALDVNEDWTNVARRYFERAGQAHKLELRLAPAVVTLEALVAEGAGGSFDFCFIDADKENYNTYYERCLDLLRPGGAIGIDNALWSGAVADPSDQDVGTVAIRRLNERIAADERVTASLVPIGDGLWIVRKH